MPLDLRGLTWIQRAARAASGAIGRDAWVVRRARPVYQSVLHRLSGGRGIPWSINGVRYRIDPRFRHRLGAEYETDVARYLREHIRPGDVCIDVGANIGAYVLQLARWSAPGGRTVAFEPNPEALDVLERHVRMNDLESTVTIVRSAVGADEGTGVLQAAGADGMSRLDVPNPILADAARPISVAMITLDSYCAIHTLRPHWIVVDVEGFEGDVLLGARRTVHSGVLRGIVAEFHPSVWTAAPFAPGGLGAVLDELRLMATPLAGQRDIFAQHGPVLLVPAP